MINLLIIFPAHYAYHFYCFITVLAECTLKPVISNHSKIGKMKVLKTGGSLMQVKNIALGHSASLLTCIKILSVLKTNFVVFF